MQKKKKLQFTCHFSQTYCLRVKFKLVDVIVSEFCSVYWSHTEYRACDTRSWCAAKAASDFRSIPRHSALPFAEAVAQSLPPLRVSILPRSIYIDICRGASHDDFGRFSRRRAQLMITPGKRAARTFARITYPIYAFVYGRISVQREEGREGAFNDSATTSGQSFLNCAAPIFATSARRFSRN